LRGFVVPPTLFVTLPPVLYVMEINEIESQVKKLCARLEAAADDQEIGTILKELRGALHEHTEAVRRLAFASIRGTSGEPIKKQIPKNDSASKAAD